MIDGGDELYIAPQVLFEFWVVATRPAERNGLALEPGVARQKADEFLAAFSLLPDPLDLTARWLDLCTRYSVRGRAAHDARLVAWMLGHEMKRIVTRNADDFSRYSEIECIVPS